jgi:hypothetical protein
LGALGDVITSKQKRGVSHCGLDIYIGQYLKAKEENSYGKFKYLTMQKYNLQKNLLKETKILQDIITQLVCK